MTDVQQPLLTFMGGANVSDEYNTNDMWDDQQFYVKLLTVAAGIQRNYLIVICAIGWPGNLAAVITTTTVRPVSTAAFLVALLALSDSVTLLVKLVINQVYISRDTVSNAFCRSLAVVYVCSSFANWVLVLIGFERLVAVVLPVMRNRFLSKRRVYWLCVCVALIIFSVQAPGIRGNVAVNHTNCGPTEDMAFYVQRVWPWLNVLITFLMPQILLFAICTVLCITLRRAKRRRRTMLGVIHGCSPLHTSKEITRSERAMTSVMFAAALFFMVMVLPQCLYYVLFHYTDVCLHLRHTVVDFFIRQITTLMVDSTHALNFYLFFITVRRFRKRFLALLLCQKRRGPAYLQSSVTRSSNRDHLMNHVTEDGGKTHAINGCTHKTAEPLAVPISTAVDREEADSQEEQTAVDSIHSTPTQLAAQLATSEVQSMIDDVDDEAEDA